ncbi:MAG: N-methyl-L-tryptophan oxidase [Bacillota bacterium]
MSSGTYPELPVIVVGLGAMGSATAYQLAKRGVRVIGIDRYRPPHTEGSHCGETRITRKAIGEGEAYVPLVLRSYDLWREIEEATGESLLEVTGGLWISSTKPRAETHVANFFANTVAAARRFGIAHELLDASAIRRRFPVFKVRDDEHAYFEPEAGFLRAEACVRAQLELALRFGAELKLDERVERISQAGNEVRVVTERGEYIASQAVICAGAGAIDLLPPEMSRLLTATRQVQYWFEAKGHEELPVWIWELQNREHGIYGFPSRNGLAKIATEAFTGGLDASYVRDELVAPNIEGIGRCVKTVPCLYTATPDFHFLIDRHPSMDRVIVASPCSGHGFKHSAAIGEALAQRIGEGRSAIDLSPFALSRFAAP